MTGLFTLKMCLIIDFTFDSLIKKITSFVFYRKQEQGSRTGGCQVSSVCPSV